MSFKVRKYGFVGGSYGRCNESRMIKELLKNGPFVVSFEPDYYFTLYKKGIYKTGPTGWLPNCLSKPEWQKVDHSVTLVGFGEEKIGGKQVKYWLLLNSWGHHWGEEGYFRMLRGEDHLGIESICESGDPYIKFN